MRPNVRSISGAALMLVIIPIFAGLLACMPDYVPLGNPEKARVDEDMNGMWFVASEEADEFLIGQFLFFKPWDKRTWLISNVIVELPDEVDLEDFEFVGDLASYEGFVEFFESPEVDESAFEYGVFQYKSWLVKLGGETFMTWEMQPAVDDPEKLLEPWFWQDFRVTESSPDRILMHLIDPSFEPLDEAPDTRRGWEKVVRKYADDDALYFEDDIVFQRVREEDLEVFVGLLNQALLGPIM